MTITITIPFPDQSRPEDCHDHGICLANGYEE